MRVPLIATICLMIAAAGLSGGGIYLWQHQAATAQADELQQKIDGLKASTVKSSGQIDADGYMVITELGIRFKPGDLKDLVYVIDDSKPGYLDAAFSSRSLMLAAYKSNGTDKNKFWCTPGDLPFGSIRRATGSTGTTNGPSNPNSLSGGQVIKSFDASNVVFFPAKNACTQDKATLDVQQKQYDLFRAAISTAEPI